MLLVAGNNGSLEFLESEAGNLVSMKLVSERLFEIGTGGIERASERARVNVKTLSNDRT